jgi:hypothetical protein
VITGETLDSRLRGNDEGGCESHDVPRQCASPPHSVILYDAADPLDIAIAPAPVIPAQAGIQKGGEE